MAEQIRRVTVWRGWLRLAHGLLAGATLVLMATGWLVANAPSVAEAAADWHYLAAGVLLFAIVLRVFLGLFGEGAERFEHLMPTSSEWPSVRASALFYLSLGKAPLPNWFAHNPFWKLLYLFLLIVLVLAALSGWLMPDRPLIGRFYLPHVHALLADMVSIWVLAHLYCVILQDYRGRSADVSAMISGDRYFSVDRDTLVKPEMPQVSIRLDSLSGGRSQRDD